MDWAGRWVIGIGRLVDFGFFWRGLFGGEGCVCDARNNLQERVYR